MNLVLEKASKRMLTEFLVAVLVVFSFLPVCLPSCCKTPLRPAPGLQYGVADYAVPGGGIFEKV